MLNTGMKSHEFTINIPINIKIDGNGDPEISTDQDVDTPELDQNPVMVSPLQQELELKKAELGKQSPVIDKLTADDTIGQEPEAKTDAVTPDTDQLTLDRLKSLIQHLKQSRSS